MTYDTMAVRTIDFRVATGDQTSLFFGSDDIRQSGGFKGEPIRFKGDSSRFKGEDSGFKWRPEKRTDIKSAMDSWWGDVSLFALDFRSSFCESFAGVCHPIETLKTIERGWRYNLYLLCIASFATAFVVFS